MSNNAGHSQDKKIFAYKVCEENAKSIKVEFWAEGGNIIAEFLSIHIASYIAQIEDALADGAEYLNYLDGTYVVPSNLLSNLKSEFTSYILKRANDANSSGATTPNCKDTQSRTEASVQDNSISARQISNEKHFNEERRIKNEELNTTQALDIVRIANETNSNTCEGIRFEDSENLNSSFFNCSSLKTKHNRSTLVASVIQS